MKKLFLSLLPTLFVLGCSVESPTAPQKIKMPNHHDGISPSIINLSPDDAIQVSRLFNNHQQTKSSSNIAEVVPVTDSLDSPFLYAVNYDNGFTIVSATKKYHPVLADVENGTFTWPTNTGADIIIQQYIDDISNVIYSDDAPILKDEWKAFEFQECRPPITKVNDESTLKSQRPLTTHYPPVEG